VSALTIMAVGGGNMRLGETRRIDERVVELTGTQSPRAVFVPTASGDNLDYTDAFREVYGERLGARVGVLELLRRRPSAAEVRDLLSGADLIYVGGGNTLRMMNLWRRQGVDRLIRAAGRRGAVLAGSSAGGICWFDAGHSDSRAYAGTHNWSYIRVSGLGLVGATFCPHYHAESREEDVARMVAHRGDTVVACDNHTAIELVGGRWRVFRSRRTGRAYHIVRQRGEAVVERLPADHEYRPLSQLLSREPSFG
jgi:dipeptidase E